MVALSTAVSFLSLFKLEGRNTLMACAWFSVDLFSYIIKPVGHAPLTYTPTCVLSPSVNQAQAGYAF